MPGRYTRRKGLLGLLALPLAAAGLGARAVAAGRLGANRVSLPHISVAPTPPSFYIDSNTGSDANSGLAPDTPWRSLAPVNDREMEPGQVVNLAVGSQFDGGLIVRSSGSPAQPIVIQSYGRGERPVVRNPGNMTTAVDIEGSWVVVQGLMVREAHYAGVRIAGGATHCLVRNCEATGVGIGVAIHGQYNLVTGNYAHDLTMVRNTPGGDDDFGAVGVWLFASNNEVSYNRMERCIAPSHDYGYDGGGIEWFGDVHETYVHHNWVSDSDGFMEVGGGSIRDAVVAYNVSVNNHNVAFFHLAGKFQADVHGFHFEHNTVVDLTEEQHWAAVGFRGDPAADTLIMRNNIFSLRRFWWLASDSGFSHSHNLYHLESSRTNLGLDLGSGELLADPRFADTWNWDFRLRPGSPAIGGGTPLGYSMDFDGRALPEGAPAMGAFGVAAE